MVILRAKPDGGRRVNQAQTTEPEAEIRFSAVRSTSNLSQRLLHKNFDSSSSRFLF